jgi:photosystem II stability/assembly factor-like uncharacterized protein
VVWASGSQGTVGRSLDGGRTWQWQQVPGYEARDFRDVEAFDADTALLMAVAEPACILKTTDGGQTWRVVFADSTKGMFLDAMHFRDALPRHRRGRPGGRATFRAGATDDGGKHLAGRHTPPWRPIPEPVLRPAAATCSCWRRHYRW